MWFASSCDVQVSAMECRSIVGFFYNKPGFLCISVVSIRGTKIVDVIPFGNGLTS